MQDNSTRDQTAAVAAVRRRMAEKQLSAPQLAKRAGVAANTVRSFLAGETWPIMSTMGRIEKALDWPPGYVEDLALGIEAGREPPLDDVPGVRTITGEDGTVLILKIPASAREGRTEAELEEAYHAAVAAYLRILREQGRA